MARKRWRPGRRSKAGLRYPGGQLRPANDKGTPELLSRRADEVGKQHAESEHAAWYCGQLFLRGEITGGQRDAAWRWKVRALAYKRLLGGPPPLNGAMFRMPYGEAPDDASEYEQAKANFYLCKHAVGRCGWKAYAATEAAVFDERKTDVSLIRQGLEELRKALGIQEE